MYTEPMDTEEEKRRIRKRGYQALRKELGVDGMLSFITQLSPGKGDYTAERHAWLDNLTMDDVLRDVRENARRRQAKEKAAVAEAWQKGEGAK